jgi:hypothetical protein
MADVLTEQVRTLSQAAKHPLLLNPDTGRPVDRTALFRWITDGKLTINGDVVKLEATKHPVGRRLVTSDQAIERFVARIRGTDPSEAPPTKHPRGGQLRRARRELSKAVGTSH